VPIFHPRVFLAFQVSDPDVFLGMGTYANSDETAGGMLAALHVPGAAVWHGSHQHVLFYQYSNDYSDQYGIPEETDVPIEVSIAYWEALSAAMSPLFNDGEAEQYHPASIIMNPTENVVFYNEIPIA
jgi:hypothetical protein